jgi:hypothetical protein
MVIYHDLLQMTDQMSYNLIKIQLLFQVIKEVSLCNGNTVARIKALNAAVNLPITHVQTLE